MDLYELATQTIIEISKITPVAWFKLSETIPFIGEWTPCPLTQRLVKKPFIQRVLTKHSWSGLPYDCWYLNGLEHRDGDLPSSKLPNGDMHWYKFGLQHRDHDLPAVEFANGNKYWYKNGLRHRSKDLPAIEYANGDKIWYTHGKWHRDHDLPAIEFANGVSVWSDKSVPSGMRFPAWFAAT
jgi:hypothetical protein